ncbi:protein of unknown function DUF4157 [Actinobacteria bacterium OK074]|nr:protein of unknown function DUF4157 [Actinobacteria bacterium OK074]
MHASKDRNQADRDGTKHPTANRPTRPAPDRVSGTAAGLLALQRTAGNGAVARAIAAERTAVRDTAGQDQEQHEHSPGCEHANQAPVQRRYDADADVEPRSEPRSDEQLAVQGRSSVYEAIDSPAQSLEPGIKAKAEQAYDINLSQVSVHSGPVAQRSAKEHGALAYTSGDHIVLAEPKVDEETMLHELDHVRQQRQGQVAGTDNGSGAKVSSPDDPFEQQSSANGRKVAQGHAPDLGLPGRPAPVQRAQRAHRETDGTDESARP